MVTCTQCGRTAYKGHRLCSRCKKLQKQNEELPHVRLTKIEKQHSGDLRMAYDPDFAFDQFFKKVTDSL